MFNSVARDEWMGGYRNWYLNFGHCGVINDLGSSTQPSGCGELPRSLVTPQWPKLRYRFLFYHDASKHIKSMQIRACISRNFLIKLLQISHGWKHGHRPLSQPYITYLPHLGCHSHLASVLFLYWRRTYQWNFSNKIILYELTCAHIWLWYKNTL